MTPKRTRRGEVWTLPSGRKVVASAATCRAMDEAVVRFRAALERLAKR